MKTSQDAYGQQLLAQYHSKQPTVEIIERDELSFEKDSGYFDARGWKKVFALILAAPFFR